MIHCKIVCLVLGQKVAGLRLTQKASNRQFSFSPNTERRPDYQGSEKKAEERHGPLVMHAMP